MRWEAYQIKMKAQRWGQGDFPSQRKRLGANQVSEGSATKTTPTPLTSTASPRGPGRGQQGTTLCHGNQPSLSLPDSSKLCSFTSSVKILSWITHFAFSKLYSQFPSKAYFLLTFSQLLPQDHPTVPSRLERISFSPQSSRSQPHTPRSWS